jgi:hypothetical protein
MSPLRTGWQRRASPVGSVSRSQSSSSPPRPRGRELSGRRSRIEPTGAEVRRCSDEGGVSVISMPPHRDDVLSLRHSQLDADPRVATASSARRSSTAEHDDVGLPRWRYGERDARQPRGSQLPGRRSGGGDQRARHNRLGVPRPSGARQRHGEGWHRRRIWVSTRGSSAAATYNNRTLGIGGGGGATAGSSTASEIDHNNFTDDRLHRRATPAAGMRAAG